MTNSVGNCAAEGTSQCCTAQEYSNSRRALLRFIPETQVKDHTGKDSGFECAEEETQDCDLGKGMSAGNAGAEASEANDEEAEPPETLERVGKIDEEPHKFGEKTLRARLLGASKME